VNGTGEAVHSTGGARECAPVGSAADEPVQQSRIGVAKDTPLQVLLLGRPRLDVDGRVCALERKDAALLALLALDGPTARVRVALLLWPDRGEAGARANLRQRLHRMRRLAGRDLVEGADELVLAAGVVHELDCLPARLAADPQSLEGELLGALDYADCSEFADWLVAARERWRHARRDALAAIGASLEAQDRVVAALACAERLARDEPALEPAYRTLMRLHVRRGDRAAALAAYERCRTALARELASAPDPQTRALHAKILRGATDGISAPVPGTVAVLRPPRLVGRDREWAELAAAWQRGRIVVLVGEPGAGKTRLLTDFAVSQPGCLIVGGRPGDTLDAYAVLGRLLIRLLVHVQGPLPGWVDAQLGLMLPGRASSPAPAWNPVRLRQALVEVLKRTSADVRGVLVDDAQFCDVATLQMLTTVSQETGAGGKSAVQWLFAVRANEVPPMFAAWLSATDGERVQELRLATLDLQGVAALLSSLAIDGLDAEAVAPALLQHTGGNPMFLLETLRALLAPGASSAATSWQQAVTLPVPVRVGELIARRLAQLPADALDLAHVAALAGQDFDAALGAAVLERHALDLADPWRELENAQVIRGAAFAHDLIFEATLRSVPAARAVDLHARIAAWLARNSGELARIAFHWKGAQRWAEAGHAFATAAARLRSRLRRDEEAALLQEADACFARIGDDDARADVLRHLVHAHWDRKFRPGVRAAVALLCEVARTPVARVWAMIWHANLVADERPDEASLAMYVAAREAAERLDDEEGGEERPLLYILTKEASLSAILNKVDDALRTCRRIAELVDPLPAHRWIGHFHFNLGFAFEVCGHLTEAMARLDRAERIFRELDEPVHVSDTRSMSTNALYHLGHLGEATARLAAGRRTWAEVNGGRAEPHTADVYIARYWREAGRLGPALELMLDTVERAGRIPDANLQAWAATELAALFVLLGQPARARKPLELARAAFKVSVRVDGLLIEASLARALGESPEPAIAAARALLPVCQRGERIGWFCDVERARSMSARDAAALMQANFEAAMAKQMWSAAAPSWAMWIDAQTRAGDHAGAAVQARALATVLAEGTRTLERPPLLLYAPEYYLILFRAFTAAGDDAAARDAVARGAAWIHDTALPHVPAEFRDGFLERNEVNRNLLALARRASA
jgi:DNA-binding SARP family transcriptional activator